MTFKEKITNCEKIIGTHVGLTDASVTEMVSYLGFDYIWLDMEHTAVSVEEAYHHILAARSGGTPILIRVPVSDLTYAKRIAEMGPDGILFPMVRDANHAKELLDWTLYPPIGTRGCGPRSAVKWGIDDEVEYYSKGSLNMCRFIQIERKSAVDDIENIAKIPYLDGCIFGLFDLSGSIGKPGDIYCKENLEMIKRTVDVLKAHNKTIGISTGSKDIEGLKRLDEMGINMLTTGFDYVSIIEGAKQVKHNAMVAQNKIQNN